MRRDVFQAIADPNRRAILGLLANQKLTLNGVAEKFDISRPAISKHIKILSQCGLVTIRKQGRERYCEARLDKLNEVTDWVEHNRKIWEERFDALEEYLKELQTKETQMTEEFSISRVFHAPRELVFKAWTEPERLAQWWGPKGFTIISQILDLRPGGLYHYGMRSPDGFIMWGKLVYHEIIAPEKMVFVNSFSDEMGNPTRHPMSATWPLEIQNTLTFTEQDGKTTLTLRGCPIRATEEEAATFKAGFSSLQQGFKGTLDQLDTYLTQTLKGQQP